ncbi:hypothetical protein SFB54_03250 [Legionella pneumophila subsp. fraseri]|uniref:hypothetical protein n=1 Tax=Legionella pneumophila TaxID=446 RepID=UPI0007707345|nr:hypothetical protein [Legionella pneumophila]MDW8878228.1 hypothetical protein [Legionella pneumophila subsp. fraseri]AOW59202.1 hypothetical protein BE843_13480 [Legionella pneumophila subsp. pneumophila]AOW60609.1 hypothetical protein BE844_05290 [Legionella pneumophila subsp. pneumophila]AOW66006.1 hypothetical protein BE846_03055 [Legionella pneumophila subsp. pneumophila]MDW8962030.1 hypothetical protein [Legionella pneumophila subsp. fraseri]
MNTYEKLVYLATEPIDNKIVLCDKKGSKLKSSLAVQEELKDEFIHADLSIDIRRACETHLSFVLR